MILALCTGAVLVLAAMSRLADARLPPAARLPMQWGLHGRPTWHAPRPVALAFTPVLAALVLTLAALLGDDPRGLAGIALIFVAVHALHLSLIRRHLSRS